MYVKRIVAAYCFVMFLVVIAICGVASASLNGRIYAEAVGQQSRYTLTVAESRGTIYDRNLEPLTNSSRRYVAAVIPNVEAASALYAATGGEQRDRLRSALESGTPFLLEVDHPVKTDSIESFEVFARYSDAQPAANLIGYLENGSGTGGIELSFDDLLAESSGVIRVTFTVDALGNAIPGEGAEVENTYRTAMGGVVLTLDRNIQTGVEEACADISRGAAVVLRCDTGEIVASASFPAIDANHLDACLENPDAPFVNRALSAYAPGSVFKLFAAAAALEDGFDYNAVYTCAGSITVDGLEFACYDGRAHGEVNLHTALRKSCNGYFVRLLQQIEPARVLSLCKTLGLGSQNMLADGLTGSAGVLPALTTLQNARAQANFSFGQGETTTTPLQIAAAVNAIANGGTYFEPTLVLGIADAEPKLTEALPAVSGTKAMELTTSNRLRAYMESTARFGTARAGSPEGCVSGIKTGTAQTGVYAENGEEILNYWYAGYICDADNTPAYTIVVLEESAGESYAASAFKKIGEALCEFV